MRPQSPDVIAGKQPEEFRNQSPAFFYHHEGEPLEAIYTWEDPTSISLIPPEAHTGRPAEVNWHGAASEIVYTTETPRLIEQPPKFESAPHRPLGNPELPVHKEGWRIFDALEDNQIVIAVSETGSGKSTQVPQLALDAGYRNVYETQPRRAASENVYKRIHQEVSGVLGEAAADSLTSYRTAGQRDGPEDARIKVLTDGFQLMKEFNDSGALNMIEELDANGNPVRDLLIVDEVHEWNSNVEFMMAWIKKEIAHKPNLRVVIMSATMDAAPLANYLASTSPRIPPIVEIPGRMHKVERYEKPESTVVNEALLAAEEMLANKSKSSEEENGILIFQSGKREINDTIDDILRRMTPEMAKEVIIFPLHAKLSQAEQQAAFKKYPGVKIVVATNLAQTSLTIPDIKYVIDSGNQRRMELDAEGTQGLVEGPVSQADCDQRAGRAGRVFDGIYILTRADNKAVFVPYIKRDKYPTPEIQRTDFVRFSLRVSAAGEDIRDLDLFHSVDEEFCEKTVQTLQKLGALDENGKITTLGERMNEYPVRPTSSRMLAEASRYSENTRAYVAAIAAAVEVGGLPYFAYNVERRWKELTEETTSDLLAQLDMFIAIQGMDEKVMRDYDLDLHNIERARELNSKLVKRSKANQDTLLPPTQQEREDIRQCIVAGFVNSIYKYVGDGMYAPVGDSTTLREISNRSVVKGNSDIVVGNAYRVQYRSGGGTVEKHVIEHATAVSLGQLALAAPHLIEWKESEFTMRDGKFKQLARMFILGIETGSSEERVPEPSIKLQDAVIQHALEHAGSKHKELRDIKKELERLAHLAKDPVPQLTHDMIKDLVREAAPLGVTDPDLVDINLRKLVLERSIDLDSFVSADQREYIMENAPATIEVDGVTLRLTYKGRKAIVQGLRVGDIEKLSDNDIYLPDGRPVLFVHDKKRMNIHQLKGLLSTD